jgi:molybdate transport system permease protein
LKPPAFRPGAKPMANVESDVAGREAVNTPDSGARSARLAPLGRLGRVGLLSLPLFLFFVLPVLALLLRTTGASVWASLAQPEAVQAIDLSLRTTTLTAGLTVVFGTPLAFLLGRRSFPGRRAVDTLVELPTVLPPAVAGVALLVTFGRQGLVGHWLAAAGLSPAFTTAAVVLAQLFVAGPLYVKTLALGFAAIEPELEQAAAIDGASRWQAFRYIAAPLAYPAALSGAALTWARALGEFGATILFAGNFPGRTQTMPLAIYIGFETSFDVALALSAILIGVSFAVLIAVKLLLQQDANN